MKNKNILITGAAGFIGSHLTEQLVNQGASVRAFIHYNSRNDIGFLNYLDKNIQDSIEIIASDITDPLSINKAMDNIDIVFHLAALIGIPYSYYSPNSYVETNIKGTLNVLNAARENNVTKIVHTSTSEVYGTAIYTPIDEKHPLQAQSPYAATKIAADKLAESYYLSFGLPVTIIRPFNTYGPRQSLRAVIPTIITQALYGDTINLGNTDTIRDFNYVLDTVKGFIAVSKCEANNGIVTNIGSGEGVKIIDVVNNIGSILNKNLTVVQAEERLRPDKSEVFKLICDSTQAEKLTTWKPEYTLHEGLTNTIKWFDTNLSKQKNHKYLV